MSTRLIKPCCADQQVPAAIRERGAAMTTTSGDVTMQHWMRSCSYMAGPNWVLTIQTRSLTVAHLRHVREWMQRQWASEVRLTIAQDQRKLISAELEGLTDRVSMAIEEKLTDEAIAFSGDRGNVIVAGRVIAELQPALSIYAISHTQPGEEDEVYQALCSRHKLHKVDCIAHSALPLGSSKNAAEPQKRVRRKKATS